MNGMPPEKKIKKIVLFSAFYEPFMSGAEQMAKEIAENLGARFEIVLIAARLDKELPRFEQRPKFKLLRVGLGSKFDKFLYPLFAPLAARKFKPEVAHAIMESYAGGALAVFKYLYPRAKRILTLQSGDLDHQKKQKQFLIKLFWKAIHRSPDRVTAISNFLAQRAKNLGVQENVLITPNGVDLSKIPSGVKPIQNRVICVARLSWEKGLDYLVKAWPEVLRQKPEAKLVLVGEGDKRKEIESLIRGLGVSDSIELKGSLPHDLVLEELKKSDVFICPSLAEGLGIVFIEAQACGLAVIGTKVGGIPDVIENMENGLLIESKSSVAISDAITKLLLNKDLARNLKARALETVKKFDWKSVLVQFERLYNAI